MEAVRELEEIEYVKATSWYAPRVSEELFTWGASALAPSAPPNCHPAVGTETVHDPLPETDAETLLKPLAVTWAKAEVARESKRRTQN
jgi:hypothetical protein